MFPFAGMIALEITEVDNMLCGLGVAIYSQLDWGDAEDDRAGESSRPTDVRHGALQNNQRY